MTRHQRRGERGRGSDLAGEPGSGRGHGGHRAGRAILAAALRRRGSRGVRRVVQCAPGKREGNAMDAAPGAAPMACENCSTMLQGRFCHVCGQHAVNPMRHFGHAVEEFFESFWHLDGRVFRTLRDLLVPGRVACNYLAGQRVRYIAPLRLFVVLTLLTFFVGQIAVSSLPEDAPGDAGATPRLEGDAGSGSIQRARTEAAVNAALAEQLDGLRRARAGAGFVRGAAAGLDQAEAELRRLADARIRALRAARPGTAAPAAGAGAPAAAPARASTTTPTSAPTGNARPGTRVGATQAEAAPGTPGSRQQQTRHGIQQMAAATGRLRDPKAAWHQRENPVDFRWLPPWIDRWLNHRLENMAQNAERMAKEGRQDATLLALAMAAVPPALFLLMPVFALLLKLLHAFTPRAYLEHLVVALYSHAFMLLVLLVTFVMLLVRSAVPAGGVAASVAGGVQTLAWVALPVYLFAMQYRVYRQHWLLTVAKYLALGAAYMVMVGLVVVYSVVAGLSSGG